MAYFSFSYGGNLEFLDFLQKKFYNINYSWLYYLLNQYLYIYHNEHLPNTVK